MDEPETTQRHERLSVSSLDDWEKCPRSWKAERIDGARTPPTFATLTGTYGHAILEELHAMEPSWRTIGAAKDIAARMWDEFAAGDEYLSLELDERGQRAFKNAVWAGIEGYFGMEDPSRVHLGDGSARELAVEVELGGVKFVGHVDRLDVAALGDEIVDYKFGKAPDPRYREQKKRQNRLYAAALEALGRPRARRGTLLYVSEGVRVTELLTEAKLDAAVGDVQRAWGEIQAAREADQFAPKPGPLCGWCAEVIRCPEGEREVRIRASQGRLKHSAPARSALGL